MLDNLLKIGLLGAIAYGAWYWYSMESTSGGSTTHIEQACRDAINSRFDLTRVRVFDVRENSNGYTVRASGTLGNGGAAKLVCLTSRNGDVRDVTIEHH